MSTDTSTTERIPWRTALLLLAAKIAEGMPAYKQIIQFQADAFGLLFETSQDLQVWAEGLTLRLTEPHQSEQNGTWIHGAYGLWRGWSVQANAYVDSEPPVGELSDVETSAVTVIANALAKPTPAQVAAAILTPDAEVAA